MMAKHAAQILLVILAVVTLGRLQNSSSTNTEESFLVGVYVRVKGMMISCRTPDMSLSSIRVANHIYNLDTGEGM